MDGHDDDEHQARPCVDIPEEMPQSEEETAARSGTPGQHKPIDQPGDPQKAEQQKREQVDDPKLVCFVFACQNVVSFSSTFISSEIYRWAARYAYAYGLSILLIHWVAAASSLKMPICVG